MTSMLLSKKIPGVRRCWLPIVMSVMKDSGLNRRSISLMNGKQNVICCFPGRIEKLFIACKWEWNGSIVTGRNGSCGKLFFQACLSRVGGYALYHIASGGGYVWSSEYVQREDMRHTHPSKAWDLGYPLAHIHTHTHTLTSSLSGHFWTRFILSQKWWKEWRPYCYINRINKLNI